MLKKQNTFNVVSVHTAYALARKNTAQHRDITSRWEIGFTDVISQTTESNLTHNGSQVTELWTASLLIPWSSSTQRQTHVHHLKSYKWADPVSELLQTATLTLFSWTKQAVPQLRRSGRSKLAWLHKTREIIPDPPNNKLIKINK